MQSSPSRLPSQPENNSKELNPLKYAFVRNVEHELRTPLSVIQGYAELLNKGELGNLAPEQAHAVSVICTQADKIRTLVERLGVLLSVEGGVGVSIPVSLRGVVEKAVREQREAVAQAGLALEIRLDTDIPLVAGDPYHLQHALICLIENAVGSTPRGGQIWVQTYKELDQVCFAVSNTGVGISQHDLAILLGDQEQPKGNSSAPAPGGGAQKDREPLANAPKLDQVSRLGNSLTATQKDEIRWNLVKAVVKAHGGWIEARNRSGQGCQIAIHLPVLTHAASTTSDEMVLDPYGEWLLPPATNTMEEVALFRGA